MLTYTTAKSLLQKLTGNYSTDGTALLVQFWNDSRRTVAAINGGKAPWLETEQTSLTVADQDYVQVPNNIRRVINVRQQNGVAVGSVIYPIRLVFDPDFWNRILAMLLGSSDVPYLAYQREQKLYIQPTPSSNGNLVIMRGRLKITDLSIEDYTTGTIVSIANAATTVTGSGTAWAAGMAGQYIRITQTAAANGGDNEWYQVASVTSATVLELTKKYQGTSISAGSATYTMGQITYEPESYHMAPIYRAIAQYWDHKEDMTLSQRYWRSYDGGVEAGLSKEYGGLVGQMLEEANESMEGNYMSPLPRAGETPGQVIPYWFPWDDATGF